MENISKYAYESCSVNKECMGAELNTLERKDMDMDESEFNEKANKWVRQQFKERRSGYCPNYGPVSDKFA